MSKLNRWFGSQIDPGNAVDTQLVISESYSGRDVVVPIHVRRGMEDGPTAFITGALHGDELNGTGAIRALLTDSSWKLDRGTLILIPVLNVLGFERHSRYLPDRRDLNRCFPGSASGSMANRMAKVVFDSVIARCDFGIDLHTAAVRRTNFPNVRCDFANAECLRIAEAFGAGIILDNKGPKRSLRREATDSGCPTIVVEGGEVWKVESSVVQCMLRGVLNVLAEMNMMSPTRAAPIQQARIRDTKWLRAERGGFLEMHVAPGDTVEVGQPIATNTSLLGAEQNRVLSPINGVVIGMTTLPAVQPGEPIVHIGRLSGPKSVRRQAKRIANDEVQRTAMEHLATNIHVVDAADENE